MNIVWGIMIAIGMIVGMINGNAGILVDSMITGCGEAVTLCITLAGAFMMWQGFMEVAKDMGIIDKFAKIINPFMKKLFPDAGEAVVPITLNLAANFFCIGSAATPFGLEAMQKLQKNNPNPNIATNNMCMFIALNASALELLPTGVLALRTSAGSTDTYSIVIPTVIVSIISFVSAIILCKIFEKQKKKECR